MPDNLTSLNTNSNLPYYATTIHLRNSFANIHSYYSYYFEYVEEYIVEDGNATYSSKDGVLFNADKTELITYPMMKKDQSYEIPATVKTIRAEAFRNNDYITSVVIPNSVTTIGDRAFYDCDRLETVSIPGSVTSIGASAFKSCDVLKTVELGNGIESIGSSAFASCIKLQSPTLPNSLTSLGSSAFSDCTSITEIVIPDSITTIPTYAFSGCTYLEKVDLGKNVTTINNYAFQSCSRVAELTLPDNLTSLNINSNLPFSATTIYLRDTVTELHTNYYYYFDNVMEYVVAYRNEAYYAENGVVFNKDGSELLLYPAQKRETAYTVPTTVTTIRDYAFYGCKTLKSIVIPIETLTIGNSAFYNCSNLATVYYCGTSTDWDEISIGSSNSALTSAEMVFNYGLTEQTYSFVTNGGTAIEDMVAVTVETSPITTLDGWFLAGWYDNAELSGEAIRFPYYSTTKTTLYAKWADHMPYPESLHPYKSNTEEIYTYTHNVDADVLFVTFSVDTQLVSGDTLRIYDGNEELVGTYSRTQLAGKTIEVPGNNFKIVLSADYYYQHSYYGFKVTSIESCVHSYSSTVTEPTCTAQGYTTYVCANCGDEYKADYVDAKGHSYEVSGTTEPKCETEGYTTYTCTVCSDSYNSDFIAALSHDYAEEWTTVEATCTEKGYKYHKCSRCDSKGELTYETELGHDYTSEVIAPTCTTQGYTLHSCSRCDGSYKDNYVASLGHDFSEEWTIDREATCTVDGSKSHHCSRCEEKSNVTTITAPGHNYTSVVTAPTCTEQGYTTHSCSACDSSYKDTYVSATGHNYGEWEIATEATDTKVGLKKRVCSNCNHTQTKTILVNNLNEGTVNITVLDANTNEPLSNALVSIPVGSWYIECRTDSNGVASTTLPTGTYAAQAYVSGYTLKTVSFEVDTGETNCTVSLSERPKLTGYLTSHVMTYDEIIDAGISTGSSGNQQIYKYEVKLQFTEGIETYDLNFDVYADILGNIVDKIGNIDIPDELLPSQVPTIGGGVAGGIGGGGTGSGIFIGGSNNTSNDPSTAVGDGTLSDGITINVAGTPITIYPMTQQFYLIVYGEAKWMKEMFDVELLLINDSESTVTDCVATLDIPTGLSLADMINGQQSAEQAFDDIAPGGTASVHWYLRGDTEGTYNLSATVKGMFVPENEEFEYVYETQTPIKVYAGGALKLNLILEDAAIKDETYTMTFEIENISDRTIYNLSHQVVDGGQYAEKSYALSGNSAGNVTYTTMGDSDYIFVKELKPGEKISIELKTDIMFDSAIKELAEKTTLTNNLLQNLGLRYFCEDAADSLDMLATILSNIDVRYYLTSPVVTSLEGSTTDIQYEITMKQVEHPSLIKKLAESDPEILEEAGKYIRFITDKTSVVNIMEKEFKDATKDYFYELVGDGVDAVTKVWFETAYDTTQTVISDAGTFELDSEIVHGLKTNYFTLYATGDSTSVVDGVLEITGKSDLVLRSASFGAAVLCLDYGTGEIFRIPITALPIIAESGLTLDGIKDYIEQIDAETTITDIGSDFADKNYRIVNADGEVVTDYEYVGSGCKIQFLDGDNVYYEADAVVTGDTSGDGMVNIFDFFEIIDYVADNGELSGANYEAGLVVSDEEISIFDAYAVLETINE